MKRDDPHLSPVRAALAEAAQAVLSRYGASKWEMAHARADIGSTAPARDGQAVRVVSDSGCGGAGMDMLNWVTEDEVRDGGIAPPRMRSLRGLRCADHTAANTWGLWCRQAPGTPGGPPPRSRMPYHLQDPHFAIMALSVPGLTHSGVAFQASRMEDGHGAELRLCDNHPQAYWRDGDGQQVALNATEALEPNVPAVLTLACEPGAQTLRLNGRVVAQAKARLAPGTLAQLLVGWGFLNYFPQPGFGGHVYALVTGRGAAEGHELDALERYVGATAGLLL